METYSRIWVLRDYGNLHSYLSTAFCTFHLVDDSKLGDLKALRSLSSEIMETGTTLETSEEGQTTLETSEEGQTTLETSEEGQTTLKTSEEGQTTLETSEESQTTLETSEVL